MPLRVTSPQGRFAAEAEILDGERITSPLRIRAISSIFT